MSCYAEKQERICCLVGGVEGRTEMGCSYSKPGSNEQKQGECVIQGARLSGRQSYVSCSKRKQELNKEVQTRVACRSLRLETGKPVSNVSN